MIVELRKFAPSDKIPGDLIKSEDWNEATKEIERLEADKLNRTGADSLQGPLTIREALGIGVTDTNNLIAKLQVEGNAIVSGNVGIGTKTPSSKLQVVGDLVLGQDAASKRFILHALGSNSNFLQITSDNTAGQWQWTQGITLSRDGKVGIGTTSPQQLLEIGPTLTTSSISGTGTIISSSNSSDTTVTGTGTQFQSQLQIGDFITVTFNGVSQTRRVASITSASQLKTDAPFDPVISVETAFTFLRQVLSVNGAFQLRGTLDITGIANTSGQISLQVRSGNSSTNFSSNQITFGNSEGLHRHAIKTRHNPDARSGNAIDFYVWRRLGSNVPAERDLYNDIGTLHTMTLDGGNVGIGTTTPSAKLHVNGDYYGQGHIYLYAFEGDGKSGTAYIQARDKSETSSLGLQLRTKNGKQVTDVMHLTADGNVGIGTTSPSTKLDVSGDITATGSVSAAGFSTTNGNISTTNGTVTAKSLSITGNSNTTFSGSISATGFSTTNGNISTTSGNILTTNGAISAASLSITGNITATFNGSVSAANFSTTNGNISTTNGNISTTSGTISAAGLTVTGSGNAIVNNGKVGIGIANPDAKLHVNGGNAFVNGNVRIGSPTPRRVYNTGLGDIRGIGPNNITGYLSRFLSQLKVGDYIQRLDSTKDVRVVVKINSDTSLDVDRSFSTTLAASYQYSTLVPTSLGDYKDILLSVAPGTIQFDAPEILGGRFMIDGATGNIGIGITSPTEKLHVQGDIRANNYLSPSSRELKTNIANLSQAEAIQVLAELNPVKFHYKDDPLKPRLGFIAEEMPELLAGDRKSVSTPDLVAILTKVVQAQQILITQLAEKVNQ